MKKAVALITLCLSFGFNNCENQNTFKGGYSGNETTRQLTEDKHTESIMIGYELQLLAEYKVSSSEFFGKGENKSFPEYPGSSYLNGNELFLLNEKGNKLIIFNTATKKTITDEKINLLIEQNAKTYYGANQVVVKDGKIYIGFLKAILCISRDGKNIIKYLTDINVDFFFVTKDSDILAFASDNVYLFKSTGERIGTYELENRTLSNENQLFIDNKIYVGSFDEIKVYEVERLKNKQDYKEIKIDSSNLPIQEPYFACVTPSYTIWFPRITRDKIVFLNRVTNTLEKTIELDKNILAPLEEELANEEGNPNLHIVAKNDREFYFILGKGGKVSIYYLSI